jgi:hypothetical protein
MKRMEADMNLNAAPDLAFYKVVGAPNDKAGLVEPASDAVCSRLATTRFYAKTRVGSGARSWTRGGPSSDIPNGSNGGGSGHWRAVASFAQLVAARVNASRP